MDLLVLGAEVNSAGLDFKSQEGEWAKVVAGYILVICSCLEVGQHAILRIGHNFYQRMNELVYLLTLLFDTTSIFRPLSVHPRSGTKYMICHRLLPDHLEQVRAFLVGARDQPGFSERGNRLIEKRRLFDIYDRISSFHSNYLHGCLVPAWQTGAQEMAGLPPNPEDIYSEYIEE
jgi:hypothetical protein